MKECQTELSLADVLQLNILMDQREVEEQSRSLDELIRQRMGR